MKFSAAALLALLGAPSIEAKVSRRVGRKARVAKKALDKRKLLSKAVPVDKHGNRRLNQEEEWEITGEYSIQFNHCLSLKTQAQNEEYMFGDDTIEYTQNGLILSQASYVLFNVCVTDNCYYEDESNLYMVDLASYLESTMSINYDDKQNYCEACQQAQDYCYPEEDEAAEDEAAEDEAADQGDEAAEEEGDNQDNEAEEDQGDGERKRRKLQEVEFINCNKCDYLECWEDEDAEEDENAIEEEDILEWVNQMSQCQALEYGNWNGNEVYASFMCNDDGSGVEIGVFLDNACSVYTSLLSYSNIMSGYDEYENYVYDSASIVTYPFLNDIDCKQVEYANPGEDQDEQEDNGEAPEANEYCRQVVENAVDLDTCGIEEDEEEQEEEEEEDNNYDWYTYDLSADDAEDVQAVCKVVQVYEGEYTNAHTYKADDGEGGGSGNVYDYTKASANGGAGLNAGKIFGIVIAAVVVIVAGIMLMQSCGGKRDAKKVPLVNKSGGSMA